jgi:hypothetical protein
MKKIELNKYPNAFAFKLKLDGDTKICICPRIENNWSEDDIFYVDEYIPKLTDELDAEKFNVIFINLIPINESESFNISIENGAFLKSNHSPAELYKENNFFKFVETGYKQMFPDS